MRLRWEVENSEEVSGDASTGGHRLGRAGGRSLACVFQA